MPEIKGRKIQRFRCTVDPMIPPRPRNAFDCGPTGDLKGWEFELTPAGIYVKAVLTIPGKREAHVEEHIIPFANIQSMKLLPETDAKKAEDDKEALKTKAKAEAATMAAEAKAKADAEKNGK